MYLVFVATEPPSLAAVGVAPRGRKLVQSFDYQRMIAARQAGEPQAVGLQLLQFLGWVGKARHETETGEGGDERKRAPTVIYPLQTNKQVIKSLLL